MTKKIPTTADLYLTVGGKKVAVVQSYKVTASRSSKTVEAFGQEEPVAVIRGQTRYVLELSRLYATDEALKDGISFADLADFDLTVCKPDRHIIYSGCQWLELEESAQVGGMVLEQVRITAAHRYETDA